MHPYIPDCDVVVLVYQNFRTGAERDVRSEFVSQRCEELTSEVSAGHLRVNPYRVGALPFNENLVAR